RLSLDRLTAAEIAAYRDQRLGVVKADTVRRELAIVHHCLRLAAEEWGIKMPSNPAGQIKMPAPGRARERRATPAELERLLTCAAGRAPWLSAVIRLALETGMRRGELLDMRWSDVDLEARTARLTRTKNGHPRTVPLSAAARELLRNTLRTGDMVFPVTA